MTGFGTVGAGQFMLLLGGAVVLFGVLFVALGVLAWRRVVKRRREWLRLPGEAYDYQWSDGDRPIQYWLIRWTGPDGVARTARNPYGTSGGTLRSFPFPVEVLVNPDDLGQAQIASGARSGPTVAVGFVVAGVLFLAFGVIVLLGQIG